MSTQNSENSNPVAITATITPTLETKEESLPSKINKRTFLSTAVAITAVVSAKGKAILVALLKLKFTGMIISMLISLFAYGKLLGWTAGVLFVTLLFIHESGHVLVNKQLGIPASLPFYIPFLGALITLKKYPKTVEEEAWAALGGPVLGSIGALACLGIWAYTRSHLWLWGASVGIWLNLFNLIPIAPLDGGRVVAAVSRRIWMIGLPVLIALGAYLHKMSILIMALICLAEINVRYKKINKYIWGLMALSILIFAIVTRDWFFIIPAIIAGVVAGVMAEVVVLQRIAFTIGQCLEYETLRRRWPLYVMYFWSVIAPLVLVLMKDRRIQLWTGAGCIAIIFMMKGRAEGKIRLNEIRHFRQFSRLYWAGFATILVPIAIVHQWDWFYLSSAALALFMTVVLSREELDSPNAPDEGDDKFDQNNQSGKQPDADDNDKSEELGSNIPTHSEAYFQIPMLKRILIGTLYCSLTLLLIGLHVWINTLGILYKQ